MERVEDLLRLILAPGVGPVTINRCLDHFGSAGAVLGADARALERVEGLRRQQREAVLAAGEIDPRPELEAAARAGVRLLGREDPGYPRMLKNTFDPPALLYVKGELRPEDIFGFGVVGTRRASRYGREQAERFGGLLARAGFAVVSGLARGIDSAAHRGALAARGRTLAVLGCGLGHVYPEENRDLAAEVARQGALLSEFPMATTPSRENFPRRNRIIAGLSVGLLVVEAPGRSGALITADLALEMGREVFALPGRIDHEGAAGCHRLIRQGAALVRGLEDILEELDPALLPNGARPGPARSTPAETAPLPFAATDPAPTDGASAPAPPAPAAGEDRILEALSREPTHIDQLCATTGLPVHEVSSALMILEIRRAVEQLPGKFFVRR